MLARRAAGPGTPVATPAGLIGSASRRDALAATDREPPFEGGAQPVEQQPDPIPPSRRSPQAAILLGLVVLFVVVGIVFLFAH